MLKALGFLIFVFLVLVAGNMMLNAAAFLFHFNSLAAGPQVFMTPSADAYNDGSEFIHASLFTKDGSGSSYVTQGYGRTPYSGLYPNGWHDGIDLAAEYDTPIYSPNSGTVIATGNQDDYCYRRAFGKYIAVKDPTNGLVLWYAHLGAIDVSPGATIAKGAEIGTVGSTGLETGTHLHFSIFEASGFTMQVRDGCGPEPTGQDVNPLNYLGSVYN